MKALVVSYCARGVRSRTKQLADHAVAYLKGKGVAPEVLDIALQAPDLLTPERLTLYYRRNYAGETLSPSETAVMAAIDRLTAQLMAADLVVLAYPMYNFSQPAIVKAWFDAVMQKGKTWDLVPGGYAGLMKGKKALLVTSSGGVYDGELAAMDHSASLTALDFGFMGYEVKTVKAAGLNRFPGKEEEILSLAKVRIEGALSRWS